MEENRFIMGMLGKLWLRLRSGMFVCFFIFLFLPPPPFPSSLPSFPFHIPLKLQRGVGVQRDRSFSFFCLFFYRWECVSNKLYKYSLMYEASGVGDMLFEDFRLRLDGDPRAVTFLILYVYFPLLNK